MRKIRIFAALAAIASLGIACNRISMPSAPRATEAEAPSKFVPYEAQFIDVPEGTKAAIYMGNTLVATCYKPGYVVLPKCLCATKSLDEYQIVTMPCDAVSGIASENTLEMVVAFEDTKTGDHDYNDLVFQAHLDIVNSESGSSKVNIDLTPVAMGANMRLGLGVVLTDASGRILADELITDDCRSYMFEGDQGFINTQDNRKVYEPLNMTVTATAEGAINGISWYLISRDEKLYASNYFQACLDEANVPQGLVIMKIREDIFYKQEGDKKVYCGNDFWQFPRESAHISEVYPAFEETFLNGGSFTAFANPTGRYIDAIAAGDDGLLSENCLYTVYDAEESESGDTPASAELFYNNNGKACATPQSFEALYYSKDHSGDNFILEFSNAKGNAIDFERGDMIEAKITTCDDYPFVIGELDPTATGSTIEGYTNGNRDWWRVQDAFNNSSLERGISFPCPLYVRISKAGGIEFFIKGKYETRLPSTDPTLAHVLSLGTDTPLFFGLFSVIYAKASYEYLKVTRRYALPVDPDDPPVVVTVPVSGMTSMLDKAIVVGNSTTLSCSVLPENASNKAITWSSSNTDVATVSNGLVQTKAIGSAVITATSVDDPTISSSCTIFVTEIRPEVVLWKNFATNTSAVDQLELEIIASGTPNDNQICFNDGDYLELALRRSEIYPVDRDLFWLGSTSKDTYPCSCIIGHPTKYLEPYMIPNYWWSSGRIANIEVNQVVYFRYGCNADLKRGFGSWSTDGVHWTTYADINGNDVESEWQKIINPSRSPLIIRTARKEGDLTFSVYNYLKIVRGGAHE